MKGVGTRPTYRIFAAIALATGIVYYIFNVTYIKKLPPKEHNDIVKKKPKEDAKLENGNVKLSLANSNYGLPEKTIAEEIINHAVITAEQAVVQNRKDSLESIKSKHRKGSNTSGKLERVLEERRKSVKDGVKDSKEEGKGDRKQSIGRGSTNYGFTSDESIENPEQPAHFLDNAENEM